VIFDSQGYDDPQITNEKLWEQLIFDLQKTNNRQTIDLAKDGLAAIVIPMLIPKGSRIEENK
jgi:hypothetical protein